MCMKILISSKICQQIHMKNNFPWNQEQLILRNLMFTHPSGVLNSGSSKALNQINVILHNKKNPIVSLPIWYCLKDVKLILNFKR